MTVETLTIGYILKNFESKVLKIPLSNQILIKRVKQKPMKIDATILVPESSEWCARVSGDSPDRIRQNAILLIYGLRLFKTGPVGIDEGYIKSETSPSDFPSDKIPDLWFLRPELEVSGTYDLLKHEIKHLQSFFSKFVSLSITYPPLITAIRRFNKGIQDDSLQERFVDFMIALETLVIRNGSGEIRYKLANRIASLIGTEGRGYDIYKQVKELYDLRSNIVHSGRVDYEKLPKKTQLLESIVRKSLLGVIALSNTITLKETPSKLDECLHNIETGRRLHDHIASFWEVDFPKGT